MKEIKRKGAKTRSRKEKKKIFFQAQMKIKSPLLSLRLGAFAPLRLIFCLRAGIVDAGEAPKQKRCNQCKGNSNDKQWR